MSLSNGWIYQQNGEEVGPVSAAELKRLASKGLLSPTDRVRPETRKSWKEASKVKELFPEDVAVESEHELEPVKRSTPPQQVEEMDAVAMPAVLMETRTKDTIAPSMAGLSASAAALKAVVSESVWKRLCELALPVDDDLFWVRLVSLRTRRKEANSDEEKGFWKRASEKIATLAESAEIQTKQFFVATSDGRYFVTKQLAAMFEAWDIDKTKYERRCIWNPTSLTVILEAEASDADVVSAQFQVDLSAPYSTQLFGSPSGVIKEATEGCVEAPYESLSSFPLLYRNSDATRNSVFPTLEINPRSTVVSYSNSAFVCADDSFQSSTELPHVLGWRRAEGVLAWLSQGPEGVRLSTLSTNALVIFRDDATLLIEKLNADAQRNALDQENNAVPNSEMEPAGQIAEDSEIAQDENEESVAEVYEGDHRDLATRALNEIEELLQRKCGDLQCHRQMLAVEFRSTPHFGAEPKRLGMLWRDDEIQFYSIEPGQSERKPLEERSLKSLAGRWFLEADGEVFELHAGRRTAKLLSTITLETSQPDLQPQTRENLVLISQAVDATQAAVSATPYRMVFEGEGKLRFQASGDNSPFGSFSCDSDAVSKRSQSWNPKYGSASVTVPQHSEAALLIAPRETLISIWETRELSSLSARTQGVSLGQLYAEYNEILTRKFLSGVFGNFFLTQQRLEHRSSVDQLIEQIEAAPPGVLDNDLEMELIERLSVLEISRNQLSRWLDRCTLMYPHHQAELTRRWLRDAMGQEKLGEEYCEQEAWRVHHQTRTELRQVQAAMSRAMSELGQNLNAIAFAFPEEVRCSALAATRKAASMASKGAMVTAFAGMGTQMLFGLGRASVGDPLGVALLGTVGMSMLGRHLEKNAKETEKKIRIRAYGIQALQWWKVVLDTASIIAVESRHSIKRMQSAAMQRDRKLLEKMPEAQLLEAQKRMTAIMRKMMHEEVGSQFYEALPGSGIFGWHIVDHMANMTQSHPRLVLENFSGEVPGSLAKGLKNDG